MAYQQLLHHAFEHSLVAFRTVPIFRSEMNVEASFLESGIWDSGL